jgi:hypothetical protein
MCTVWRLPAERPAIRRADTDTQRRLVAATI